MHGVSAAVCSAAESRPGLSLRRFYLFVFVTDQHGEDHNEGETEAKGRVERDVVLDEGEGACKRSVTRPRHKTPARSSRQAGPRSLESLASCSRNHHLQALWAFYVFWAPHRKLVSVSVNNEFPFQKNQK